MTNSLFPIKIAVTGAGSELACSIIKACREFTIPVHVTGCDITQDAVGRFLCDDFVIVPPAADKDYIKVLGSMVQQKGIDVVIPSADAEFPVLARERNFFYEKYGSKILVNSCSEYERFNDKWLTFQWFEKKGIPSPRTLKIPAGSKSISLKIKEFGFPIIIKPSHGGGSRHIFKVHNLDELEKYLPIVPEPLLQEYIASDQGEYTAGTYRDENNYVHVIILKRTLKFGMTNIAASVTDQPALEDFCRNVILKTNLEGSNNIQFRIAEDGPKVLEINPRFSGTTGLRALCGFNDVEMWVTEALGLGELKKSVIRKKKFFRYMEEIEINLNDKH